MDEADYWGRLEYRISREFAAMQNWDLCHHWCDGLTPELYYLGHSEPRIAGRAWICYGQQRQEEWPFTLFLPAPVGSRDEVDWAALLPPENVTRWLAFDAASKRIQSLTLPDREDAACFSWQAAMRSSWPSSAASMHGRVVRLIGGPPSNEYNRVITCGSQRARATPRRTNCCSRRRPFYRFPKVSCPAGRRC